MWSKPVCTSRKSASAERCLRPLGATIAMATPDRKTARYSNEGLLSHRSLRKDTQEGTVITRFCRSPGIAAAFLMLFLELVLIRYLAGTVWNMGYFPNLVLLGVFIGMGLSFVGHQSVSESNSPVLLQGAAFLLALLIMFLYCKHPTVPGFSQWLGSIGGEVYFTASPGASSTWDAWIFLGLFLSVMLIFALLAQRTAKFFRVFPPLRAYTLDVAGSCAGILAFMLCSWLQLPAWSWFVALIPLFLVVLQGTRLQRQMLVLAALGVAVVLVWKQDTTLL